MSEIARLQAQALRQARLLDDVVLAFDEELRASLARLERRIGRMLRELDLDTAGRLLATRANLKQAIAARDVLRRAMEQSGVRGVIESALDGPLARVVDLVAPAKAIAARFDVDALLALREVRLEQLLGLSDDTARVLWRSVLDGVIGARPLDDLISDVASVTSTSARQARTLYDTAVSSYSRQVESLASDGEADELFIFLGPVDEKMRDWCEERVGKVYARSEIDEMDNGQLPNPFITGGGYNCRHVWKRVSLIDTELRDLASTGERAPEVAQQLQAIDE
jgi:hypothetical protein